jgi:SAM-dependent methyltransferase
MERELLLNPVQFYDGLAATYDDERFGGSYGGYIDAQEKRILRRWLAPIRGLPILDFACGTGRMSEFATHGLDPSRAMVEIARAKHPRNNILCGGVDLLPQFRTTFDAILCFHLFMHLPLAETSNIVIHLLQYIKPGGLLIFDVPSSSRRRLSGFRPSGWHGATALNRCEISAMVSENAVLQDFRGILFFPIHRIPQRVRPMLRPIDDFFGATPLNVFCAYFLCCFQRK